MSSTKLLTLNSLYELINLDGLYTVGYGWLFGMSLWITFFGGIIAFRALPRHQFGALQHKTFPVYFVQSIALSAGLIAIWVSKHPNVLSSLHQPRLAEVAVVYSLGVVLISQALNFIVVGPMTSKIMFKRQKLEKEEGVQYNDAKASADMKTLNKQFGMLHGISSLLNLGAVISLIIHGLWLGSAGGTSTL
ncbi:hypothetical protein FA15DRAFT_662353 [Coprinopsis marcescibilis]|uniref:TMEM205-like domain-containing protein n=1 Tax=Coprinopsis marcescibilis TaxID=230819 RepID=A0A5C3LC14_COPMA|nr:hypothetical protein FA15DRAFT_662353 [Coprinopsis marcescibilis]